MRWGWDVGSPARRPRARSLHADHASRGWCNVSARKPKRVTWPAETRAEAVRIARAESPKVAAERTGVGAGTIRSWLAREMAPTDRNPEREAAELEAKPATAMTVTEWADLQRLAEARYRKSVLSGSPSDQRWCAISLGVISDKLKLARESVTGPVDDDGEPIDAAAARERLGVIINLAIGRQAGAAVRELQDADEIEINRNIATRYGVMRRMEREIRWLHEERTRRQFGEPSLFGMLQDSQLNVAEDLAWRGQPSLRRPDIQAEVNAARSEPPVDLPFPLEMADLAGAMSTESKYRRDEAATSAGERFDAKTDKAQFRRRYRRHTPRKQGGRVLPLGHMGLRPQDMAPPPADPERGA